MATFNILSDYDVLLENTEEWQIGNEIRRKHITKRVAVDTGMKP